MFSINSKDVLKGLVVAVISGMVLPLLAIFQSPGFDLSTINWHQLLTIAADGALAGFASYLTKNFFSDEQGKVLGKIG